LRVEVRDRNDNILNTSRVISPDDWERLAPDGTPGQELLAHLAGINDEIGVFDLVSLRALEVQRIAIETDDIAKASGDGIEVQFQKGHFELRGGDQRKTALWAGAPQRAGGEPCDNASYLRNLYLAADLHVVTADIAFHGTDLCWEPADQWHVVTY
jgi:hypothetical protein